MNLVQRVEHWGDTHHPQWLDIVRILFGVFLCSHAGGVLLILGVLTRFACLIQVPILLGAIFFVNSDLYRPFSALILPVLTLLLLIMFLVLGNGKLSFLKSTEKASL